MELDFTAQLQPALWGLLVALWSAAIVLAASVDRREIDLPARKRLVSEWQKRWRHACASWGRGLARLATVGRALTHQLLLRERRKA